MNSNSMKYVMAILSLSVVLLTLGYCVQSYQRSYHENLSSEMLISTLLAIICVTVVILFFVSIKLFYMVRQEKIIEYQKFYIGHLYQMIGVIKSQRHDFINHMQIVYTLLQLGEANRACDYVAELCREVKITDAILQIKIPELTAILLAKKSLAEARGIILTIITQSDLEKLNIKPIELSAIIGNLVDNALEAVVNMDEENRKVDITISEKGQNIMFEVSNPGYIPSEIIEKIFVTGFSTKEDKIDHGIGLASVKYLVEKNQGSIVVESNKNELVKFTASFPH